MFKLFKRKKKKKYASNYETIYFTTLGKTKIMFKCKFCRKLNDNNYPYFPYCGCLMKNGRTPFIRGEYETL